MKARRHRATILRLHAAAIAAIATACSSSRQTLRDAERSEIAATVDTQFDSLVSAIRRLDIDRIIAAYASDSASTRALDGQLIVGPAAIQQNFRDGFGTVRSVDRLDIPERHTSVVDSRAVVVTVRVDEAFTDTGGHSTALRGTWTSVWRRRDGGWQIISDASVHQITSPATGAHKQ